MYWKRLLGAAACAVVLPSAARAQAPLFNIYAGPAYAWRTTNTAALEADGQVGFGAGAGFRFGRGTFAIEPAVLITTKTTTTKPLTDGETRLKLEYIEFPVLAVMTIGGDTKVRPFIAAGPVIGLELRCRVEFIDEFTKDELSCDHSGDRTYDRHRLDLGVSGVAGVDYKISATRRISLLARYTHGLSNISDAEDTSIDVKNRAFTVQIGYSFPLRPDDI